jgi:hypothetical protein
LRDDVVANGHRLSARRSDLTAAPPFDVAVPISEVQGFGAAIRAKRFEKSDMVRRLCDCALSDFVGTCPRS